MEVSGQLLAPAALPPGKEPLDRRLGELQSRSGRGGEEKNSQLPPAIEPQNPDHPAHSPALYRLSYRGFNNRFVCAINKCKYKWRVGLTNKAF
jgi:hypothetical protein